MLLAPPGKLHCNSTSQGYGHNLSPEDHSVRVGSNSVPRVILVKYALLGFKI